MKLPGVQDPNGLYANGRKLYAIISSTVSEDWNYMVKEWRFTIGKLWVLYAIHILKPLVEKYWMMACGIYDKQVTLVP